MSKFHFSGEVMFKFQFQLSRGEICDANFQAPCEWCEFGQVLNGQLGYLYKLGDWKTAES